jgi:hypothetical protein
MFKTQLTRIFLESGHVSVPSSLNFPVCHPKCNSALNSFSDCVTATLRLIIMSVMELGLAYLQLFDLALHFHVHISYVPCPQVLRSSGVSVCNAAGLFSYVMLCHWVVYVYVLPLGYVFFGNALCRCVRVCV